MYELRFEIRQQRFASKGVRNGVLRTLFLTSMRAVLDGVRNIESGSWSDKSQHTQYNNNH